MVESSFGEWLERQRKAAGWTQEQLAGQIGYSTIALRKIEAEERRPSEQIAARLADIFNIPPSERAAFLRFARSGWGATPAQGIADAPWLFSPAPARTNLPAAVTSLVGRETEIASIGEYLQSPDIRLVTLVGPPGIGKTRLSLESARAALSQFPDGVYFVALAPLDNASLIAPAIVQALGYVEAKQASASQQLMDGICDKHILLVLDNCEHLIEEVAPLASGLLSACSRLKIIATSREAMRLPGEWLYPVPPLEVPKEHAPADLEAAAQYPALALFVERARAARPDFKLTPENLPAVTAICVQLDGLPLAIELLATRIRWMSPQELLEKMSGSFTLSADGMRATSARQKSLGNAIGWSYHSLPPEEQKLFAGLSVFSNGFTREAADAVFSGSFPDKAVSDLVHSLTDKSLLQRTFDARSDTRFSMLVPIQQFALERLRLSGEQAQARDLHLAYFLELAEKGDGEIRGPAQVEWADRLESEKDNFRLALEWSVSTQKTEPALRLLAALGWPWEIGGHYAEARLWLEKIRLLPDVNDYPNIYARALNHIGRYAWVQDNFSEARTLLEESRAISLGLGKAGEKSLAEALIWLGLFMIASDNEASRAMLEQSLAINQKHHDERGIALSMFHSGILESSLDHKEAALSLLEESLAMFRRFGDLFFISRVSIFLGYLFQDLGQYDRARQFFEEHLRIDTQLHHWDGIAEGWLNLGNLDRLQGKLEDAEACYEQSRTICRQYGLKKSVP